MCRFRRKSRAAAGEKLTGNRPPTDVEAAALRDLFARLGSREKVYKAAWGFKNGKVAGWLNEVLSEAIVEPVLSPEVAGDQMQDDHPGDLVFDDGRLDLASPEGRRVFEQLQRAGLVRLPDVSSLIQEGA